MASPLAKPQRFLIRPAPGWVELTLSELQEILKSPTQSYKFSPSAQIENGIVVLEECDYRQAMEIVARITTAHDVEWVIHSGRVSARSGWIEFFAKSSLGELWDAELKQHIQLSATVSHPVVGTAKEVRASAVSYLKTLHIMVHDTEDEVAATGRVRIECTKNRTRILVSMGGEPLFKRQYKSQFAGATAPLPEHHAAACYLWAQSQISGDLSQEILLGKTALAVPFAGTGTAGFESLCRAMGLAPGLTRLHYGFEDFAFHPVQTMNTIRKRLRPKIELAQVEILFGDIDSNVVDGLKTGSEQFIETIGRATGLSISSLCRAGVIQNDFFKDSGVFAKSGKKIFLPLNPPYGLRLAKETGSVTIYQRLGLSLAKLGKEHAVCGYVICPDEESWSALLAKLKDFKIKSRHFTHGGRDVRLVAFESKSKRKA
jgi:23S rRNA G2445 N2-methylase RlmL